MKTIVTALIVLCGFSLMAQTSANDSLTKEVQQLKQDVSALNKLKVNGWLQAQFQYAETRGEANFDGGTFAPNSDKRFMIRRGRVKFTYNGTNSQYVLQINATERGISLTDFYALVTEPKHKTLSLAVGIMNRPFGFEIDQSSQYRESPERSRYTQILMPNERDLGAKIVFAPGKTSKLFGLRLDAGFYDGQGIYVPGTSTPASPSGSALYQPGASPVFGLNEFDFNKDFIGRLSYYRTTKNGKMKYGIGTSHYNGGNTYQTNTVYKQIYTNAAGYKDWQVQDSSTIRYKNKVEPRVYYGAEAYFSINTSIGTTIIRGEYITGTQPGISNNSASPFFMPTAGATYIRNFDGMYAYFIHRFAKTKHEMAIKYEWYDPNIKVKGTDIQGSTKNAFTSADIKYTQLGLNYTYYHTDNVKFMFAYNIITNEATGLSGYTKDLKDNILTVRVQYRF